MLHQDMGQKRFIGFIVNSTLSNHFMSYLSISLYVFMDFKILLVYNNWGVFFFGMTRISVQQNQVHGRNGKEIQTLIWTHTCEFGCSSLFPKIITEHLLKSWFLQVIACWGLPYLYFLCFTWFLYKCETMWNFLIYFFRTRSTPFNVSIHKIYKTMY